MADRRRRNVEWYVADENGNLYGDFAEKIPGRLLATLMDIRDELREIKNRLAPLQCGNFLNIPRKLDRIGRNTERKKRNANKQQK